jgi:hypothetical protein
VVRDHEQAVGRTGAGALGRELVGRRSLVEQLQRQIGGEGELDGQHVLVEGWALVRGSDHDHYPSLILQGGQEA